MSESVERNQFVPSPEVREVADTVEHVLTNVLIETYQRAAFGVRLNS